jgi:hypothetical protein
MLRLIRKLDRRNWTSVPRLKWTSFWAAGFFSGIWSQHLTTSLSLLLFISLIATGAIPIFIDWLTRTKPPSE